jgi:hypothetical protein
MEDAGLVVGLTVVSRWLPRRPEHFCVLHDTLPDHHPAAVLLLARPGHAATKWIGSRSRSWLGALAALRPPSRACRLPAAEDFMRQMAESSLPAIALSSIHGWPR